MTDDLGFFDDREGIAESVGLIDKGDKVISGIAVALA